MMYWRMFVFAVLTVSSALVQSRYVADEDFQCPVCWGQGDKAKADCDNNIEFERCHEPNPLCVSTLFYPGTFLRECSDERTYRTTLRYCEETKNCKQVMCTESKCRAEFPLDFQCPVCVGGGDKAKADCDDNIEFESCNGPNPICVSTLYSGTFHRGCSDEITYKKTLRNCEEKKNCKSGMCTESKCKAEFPLECPYCESYKSLEDCDNNRDTQKCHQSRTRCFVYQNFPENDFFMRGCMDEKTADEIAMACTEGKYGECQFGTCKESGCLASFKTEKGMTAPST